MTKDQTHQRIQMLMASPFELRVIGNLSMCSPAMEAAFQEVARIERLFTIYQSEAPLACFNRGSKKGVTFLDPEILCVLSIALGYAKKSAGAFDPAAGSLVNLWGFGPKKTTETPPSPSDVSHALRSSGYRFLRVDEEVGRLDCLNDGLQINLGGIVKGYAIDRAVSVLKKHGITRALVSCGSTSYGFGDSHWPIAIQHPRKQQGEIQRLGLSDQAIASSGDYERYFMHEGRRYSHLIDPRTGFPVSGMASVSVISKTALMADLLSTACFVLGRDAGRRFLEAESEASGFLVSEGTPGNLSFISTKTWPGYATTELGSSVSVGSKTINRRQLLKGAAVFALGILLPGNLLWPVASEASKIRFATEKEALGRMMPDADRISEDEVLLSDAALEKAQKLVGKGFRRKRYESWIGYNKENQVIAYALKLNVVGKKRPITFLVGITPEGIVKAVEVLIYRESKGSEIRYSRFMAQFHKKTLEDPLRLGRDIRSISGATLSSRATTYAVRKALALFEVVYNGEEKA